MDVTLWNAIIILAAVLLMPAIPAILIYKMLPDQKILVKTNFSGVQLNATGAFGGYFVLVLVAHQVVDRIRKDDATAAPFETYMIRGNVRIDDPADSATAVTVTVFPASQEFIRTSPTTSSFWLYASIRKSDRTAMIQLNKPQYASANVPIATSKDLVTGKSYSVIRDPQNKILTIEDTLVLRRISAPYTPTTIYNPKIIE
jgi:hypothetical protein